MKDTLNMTAAASGIITRGPQPTILDNNFTEVNVGRESFNVIMNINIITGIKQFYPSVILLKASVFLVRTVQQGNPPTFRRTSNSDVTTSSFSGDNSSLL